MTRTVGSMPCIRICHAADVETVGLEKEVTQGGIRVCSAIRSRVTAVLPSR
jgi:hypothetical protein